MDACHLIAVAGAAVVLATASGSAHAGRSCESRRPQVASVERSMALAEHTAAALERSGARVVMLARAGQNLREYGLRYSHFGIAYRDDSGRWRVVHKLNQCGTAQAAVYRQGLGEFFLDDLYEYEAAYVVPTSEVQSHLGRIVRDNARLGTLHTSA